MPANATYTVTVDTPAGYDPSMMPATPGDNENHNSGYAVTVAEANDYTIDFGFTPKTVEIGNYVWFEADGDGDATNGSPTTEAGIVVTATAPNGDVYTATTDADGAYTITVPANTCLLYTSPSPRDLSTSRMPSSA